MKNLIILALLLTLTVFCKAQGHNLVPVDSANFERIADTLTNSERIAKTLPYSSLAHWKFNTELLKTCPCSIDNTNGLILYKSSSFKTNSNKCLFLYQNDLNYYVRVGQATDIKDKSEKYIWKFKTEKIKEKTAEAYISMVKMEISKAEVPKYKDDIIVGDGVLYTFGDLEKNNFATTPKTDFSDSVKQLINTSEKLIDRNK